MTRVPLAVYQRDPAPPAPALVVAPVDADLDAGGGADLACRACGHVVTTAGARVTVAGKHEHACFNPHGYLFRFGCFAVAPGAVPRGEPSLEWTWFAGCAWRYDHCGGCAVHLGWRWQGPSGPFHGLVLSRLVERERGAGR